MKEGKQKLGKIIQKETIWEILGTFQWDFFNNVIIWALFFINSFLNFLIVQDGTFILFLIIFCSKFIYLKMLSNLHFSVEPNELENWFHHYIAVWFEELKFFQNFVFLGSSDGGSLNPRPPRCPAGEVGKGRKERGGYNGRGEGVYKAAKNYVIKKNYKDIKIFCFFGELFFLAMTTNFFFGSW